MEGVGVRIYSDPACPWSWAAEPALARLRVGFGDGVAITYIMGGLARAFTRPAETARHWLDASAASGMPCDARLWLDDPPRSSYPACLGVVAAREQGLDGSLLRRCREGFAVERRRLDSTDALVDLARTVPGLDVARFRRALDSSAVVEAFGADLEQTRAAAPELRGDAPRVAFPSACFVGAEGVEHWAYDSWSPDAWHAAALAAGATPLPDAPPDPLTALRRLGPLATPEVAAVCGLPGPLAPARLWTLATEHRVRHDGGLWRAT